MDEKQLLEAFTEAGLDTKEKVLEFLGGAVKPAAKAKLEASIAAEKEAFLVQQKDFNSRITALQAEINAL